MYYWYPVKRVAANQFPEGVRDYRQGCSAMNEVHGAEPLFFRELRPCVPKGRRNNQWRYMVRKYPYGYALSSCGPSERRAYNAERRALTPSALLRTYTPPCVLNVLSEQFRIIHKKVSPHRNETPKTPMQTGV